MSWYVRAQTPERLEELEAKVMACFEAAALATGCRMETRQMGHTFEGLDSNEIMGDLFLANSAALGRDLVRGDTEPPGQAGSTDMGNVSQVVPAIHPMLAIDAGGAVNHQKEFAAATINDSGNRAIRDGALGMAWTIIDVATNDVWDDLA